MYAQLIIIGLCLAYLSGPGQADQNGQRQQGSYETDYIVYRGPPRSPDFTQNSTQRSQYTEPSQTYTQTGVNRSRENYFNEINGTTTAITGQDLSRPHAYLQKPPTSEKQDIDNGTQFNSKDLPPAIIGGKEVLWKPPSEHISIGGQHVTVEELGPLWHVGIYSKVYIPYMQICGGTLVTTKAVISAAHCFWSSFDGALPAAQFAVGAGKLYRPWDNDQDFSYNQKSDVSAIHIPVRYRDAATNYQDDIAVVLITEEFEPNLAVKPACVDFDETFDDEHLTEGNIGMVLGWGLTEEDGRPSQILNYLEMPAVDIGKCLEDADEGFLKYITSDKICAGVTTGKALCRGDSGGGLVFYHHVDAARVPYLRGVASTAPRSTHKCNAHARAAFTHVRAHRSFLRRRIPDLEDECQKNYPRTKSLLNRYKNFEDKSEEQSAIATGQPVQLICNCFCNNTRP